MYPGFLPNWKRQQFREFRVGVGCDPSGAGEPFAGWTYGASGDDEPAAFGFGVSFGVRRPLRFLAHKLELREDQVSELARILDEIKTERAQSAVDQRRAVSAFADAIESDSFDEARAAAGAEARVQSAQRLRTAVLEALRRLHKMLDPAQRARLAYLIRTGTLSI